MPAAPIKVLLVDDDEDDFIIARELFREIGGSRYKLNWCDRFEDALEIISKGEHDVYLVDYRLGAQSGLDLLLQVQTDGCSAPIILLTGQDESDVDLLAMRAGAEDFLVKGQITAKQLERSIRYAIERKRADLEIQKLAAFPKCNPNPVLEFSADGKMTYCNESALDLARTFGRATLESILPANIKAVVHDCLTRNENRTLQTTFEQRTFSWRLVPIPASRMIHCYATELTERLNLEAQLRHSVKMDAVGQLAAGVAHDFNNILTIIQGHANLLMMNQRLDPELERPLQQICAASDRASNLIRQLLMFSSKQVMQPRSLNLNESISNISRMLHRLLGEHIILDSLTSENLPAVYADAGMMEQALLNLVINARDAMPRGGKLTISTSTALLDARLVMHNPKARPGTFVCVTVGDTGKGIDPKIINRIFEPFFTTKEVGKGTGLGLATVYGIVKQHEGWINVESQLGGGTTFKVYLPTADKKGLDPTSLEKSSVNVPLGIGSETILVVEDEPALRELVADILKSFGYQVFAASCGPEALCVWEQHKGEIDLLLTDMVMPEGVSGRELAEKLQFGNPQLKVIYTSGYSPGMAGQDIALLEGFNFLAKPYPPLKLAQLVREILDRKDKTTA
ncbi:MAG: response regulator [Verrucomicrobia bacterium]|nr:response regulator [Verrucomicrobiota bacterium]